MANLADRIGRIQPSATIAVSTLAAELKAQGKDIINLGSGEPDFDTPQHINDAAAAAMAAGQTRYTPVPGTVELREAVCRKLKRENDLDFKPADIVVSTGAKQAIMNLIQCVVDHGDEVVIIAPCWVSYPDMTAFCGGVAVPVLASADADYRISPEQLDAAMSAKTRLVMLNSPSNPSGAVYSRQQLADLGEVIAKYPNAIVCSDDIYEHITYEQDKACTFASANPSLADRTVVINGVSKAFAMTGWRIGYSASTPELAKAMSKVQSQTSSNACSIAQAAAQAALDGGLDCIKPMKEAFAARRARVKQALAGIEGVACPPIDGAFYAFSDASAAIKRLHANKKIEAADDKQLCRYLLEKVGVAAVPGTPFCSPGAFRISFAAADDMVDSALDRITSALS
ncbi:MAG: pyridoxal phosphate-dependent aminotransferase [Betaproteobacteria bacterium]|nr:pyridoxal phosphate-dependent aminotransferase [Betaproteobacteria bacterium]